MTERSVPVLEGRGLVKTFGTVNALQGADFIVDAGTVTALIGDNGAGKSTLVKVLSGVHPADDGTILLDGEPVSFRSPLDAHRLGIETVYQDLALAPHLDAAANVFLGREIRRAGVFTNKRAMRRRTMAAFRDLEVTTVQDLSMPVALLSGGQRQSVAIARSALWAKRVIFFDEPTAALGVVQTRRRVLDLIRRVRDQGLGVVLITHTLPDVLEVADRVEVLRFGRRSAHFERADVNDRTARGGDHRRLQQRDDPGGERTMSDRSVEALPPAETDPPVPVDETAGRAAVDPDDDHPGRRGLRGRIASIGWRYTLVVFAIEVAFFSDHRRRSLPHQDQPHPHRPERRRADGGRLREHVRADHGRGRPLRRLGGDPR